MVPGHAMCRTDLVTLVFGPAECLEGRREPFDLTATQYVLGIVHTQLSRGMPRKDF